MPAPAPGWSKWSASTSRKRRSKSLVSIARTKVSTESRPAGRRDCPTVPWRTARAGPAPPVRPVLSGRDQAPPTPPRSSPPRPRAVPRRRSWSCRGSPLAARAGCPTGPFRTAARVPAPAVFGVSPSVIVISSLQRAGRSGNRSAVKCNANDAICQFYYRTRLMRGALGRTRVFPLHPIRRRGL